MESNLVQDLTALRNLPSSWKVEAFNKVVSDISGGNKKTQKSDFLENGDIAVIDQGKELIAGYVNDQDLIVKNLPPYIVFGDHTRIFKFIDFPFAMGADGTKVIKLINDKKDNLRYIFYFFNSLNIPNTGYNRHYKYLKDVKIPLPSFATQQKIAAILDAADELRQKDKALVAKYDELTQALFLDMFGDPVTNPKGWEKIKFEKVGKLDRGKSKHRPRNEPKLLGGKYPLIQTGDIANCGGNITEYKSTYSEFGLAQSKLWKSGTLCITIAANIAKTGILTFDACFPDSVVGFIPNEKTNTIYTQYWMSFLQKIIEGAAPESAQKNINLEILRDLDFMLAPIKLQNQFAERVKAIEEQKSIAQASALKSEELFNSLLQKAFNGELV